MPVLLDCACGKRLQVNEEHIGKRIRCAGCGEVLLVRAPDEKRPARMIAFECECGKRMQARAEHAGKSVKCPACGDGVRVPRDPAGRDVEEEPVRRREATTLARRPIARDEEDRPRERERERERDPERDYPRSRKSKRRKGGAGLIWALVGGVSVLLLVVGLVLYLVLGGNRASAELQAAVPGDAAGFASLRVADLLATDVGKEILAALPPQGRLNISQLEQQTGLELKNVERVTLVLLTVPDQPGGNPDGWMVCHLNRAADTKKILTALKLADQPSEYKGKKYYAGPASVCFIDERTVVVAPEGPLRKAIEQFAQPKKEGQLAELTARAGSRQIAVGFVPPARLMAQIPQNPAPGMTLGSLTEVQKVYLGTGFRGRVADFEMVGMFASTAKAKEAKDILESFRAMGNLIAPQPGMDAVQVARTKQALKELSLTQTGTEVRISSSELVNLDELKRNLAGGGGAPVPIPGGW